MAEIVDGRRMDAHSVSDPNEYRRCRVQQRSRTAEETACRQVLVKAGVVGRWFTAVRLRQLAIERAGRSIRATRGAGTRARVDACGVSAASTNSASGLIADSGSHASRTRLPVISGGSSQIRGLAHADEKATRKNTRIPSTQLTGIGSIGGACLGWWACDRWRRRGHALERAALGRDGNNAVWNVERFRR